MFQPRIPTTQNTQNVFSPNMSSKNEYATMKPKYCNNCRKNGHSFYNCKTPITSFGLIVFRKRPPGNGDDGAYEYLMIRRRDTLGFIDFMRGKYSVFDKSYILNMIIQMTVSEKHRILTQSFDDIWRELWGGEPVHINSQYKSEEHISRDKFNSLKSGIVINTSGEFYTLEMLINSLDASQRDDWEFAEWGFPKGRRNYQEKDYDCAVREFCEETGYPISSLVPIQNITPFEEIFTGSNYKSYKHKYYLTYMAYENTLQPVSFQSSEVSCSEWKTYEDGVVLIRPYNIEKKRVLENIHNTITKYILL
jgi:hypothetical protein